MFHFCGYGSVHVTGVSLDSLWVVTCFGKQIEEFWFW
jgi:hypothetical protein